MGSKIGVLKIAAGRIGISFEEYQEFLALGFKWCEIGKHFAPRADFGNNRLKGDGLQPYCRDCVHVKERKSTKGRISPNRGISASEETRKKQSEAHMGERNHRWMGGKKVMKRDRIKILASRKVNHEIEASRMPSPKTLACSNCGNPAREYHHHLGYEPEHWLDVVPVCSACNKAL